MQTYEILVTNRSVKANSQNRTIVRTSVGIDRIHVLFDNAEWLGFPVTATFGNGDTLTSTSMELTHIEDSGDWAASSEVVIPWEVTSRVGSIRITFQGTDQDGNHIITAKGSPLSVIEAGDVAMGDIPESAPTVSQYEQLYADVTAKLADVSAALERLGSVVTFSDVAGIGVAGIVMPDGETITVDPDGTIHASSGFVLRPATTTELGGMIPDGETVLVDDVGRVSFATPISSETRLGCVIAGTGLSVSSSGVMGVKRLTDAQIIELTPMDGVIENGDQESY